MARFVYLRRSATQIRGVRITRSDVKRERARVRARSLLVEHRGFEPLTPTLPVLCAPNCANAPCVLIIPHLPCGVKYFSNISAKINSLCEFPFFRFFTSGIYLLRADPEKTAFVPDPTKMTTAGTKTEILPRCIRSAQRKTTSHADNKSETDTRNSSRYR